jgi:hypothetical protein
MIKIATRVFFAGNDRPHRKNQITENETPAYRPGDAVAPPLFAHRFGAIYALTLLALGYADSTGWLFTFVATPLFFLVPMGLGLFLLTLCGNGIEKLSWGPCALLVLSATLGFAVLPRTVETATLWTENATAIFYAHLVVSYIGAYRARRLFYITPEDGRNTIVSGAAIMLVSALLWWLKWGAFSDFPFADIFAEAHKLKGALQFADTGVVNYGVTEYAPLREVLSGGLYAAVGLDILRSAWTLPFWSSVFSAISVWGLLQFIFGRNVRRWIALPLVAASPLIVPTNGGLTNPATFVLLGSLIAAFRGMVATQTNSEEAVPPVLGTAAAVAILIGLTSKAGALPLVVLALSLPIIATRWRAFADSTLLTFALPIMLACAIALLHRSALLSNMTVLALALLYLGLMGLGGRLTRASASWLWALMAGLPAVTLAAACLIAATKLGWVDLHPDQALLPLFSVVTDVLIGRKLDPSDELALGFGTANALLELVRAIGPVTAVALGVAAAIWLARNPPSLIVQRIAAGGGEAEQILLTVWAWLGAMAILLFQLSGFPFAYRTSPLVLALLFIALPGLVFGGRTAANAGFPARRYPVAAAATFALLALSIAGYGARPAPGTEAYGYQLLLRPTLTVLLAATAGALLFMWRATQCHLKLFAFAAVLLLGTTADRAGIVTRFMPHSYGSRPEPIQSVSHYTGAEIDATGWIRAHAPRSVLVSDPYTLAITKALTGNPGLYDYSNLDTMHPERAEQIKGLISSVTGNGRSRQELCSRLTRQLPFISNEATVQIHRSMTGTSSRGIGDIWGISTLLRRLNRQSADETVALDGRGDAAGSLPGAQRLLQAFGGRGPKAWNMLLLVNERTLRWTASKGDERLEYFPRDKALANDLVRGMREAGFAILHAQNDRMLVVDVNCFQGASTSPAVKNLRRPLR